MSARRRTAVLAALAAGLLIPSLAGCAQSGDGNSTAPGAGTGAITSNDAPLRYSSPTGAAQLTFSSDFTVALGQADALPVALGDATLRSEAVTLPITGGTLTVDRSIGVGATVEGDLEFHDSGIGLVAGTKSIELRDLALNDLTDGGRMSGTVVAGGKTVGTNVDLFTLDGSTADPISSDRSSTSVLDGTTVSLTGAGAALIDTALGTDVFKGGEQVAVAGIRLLKG